MLVLSHGAIDGGAEIGTTLILFLASEFLIDNVSGSSSDDLKFNCFRYSP